MGIKIFQTLSESLAWFCSVGISGKILSVLHDIGGNVGRELLRLRERRLGIKDEK